MKKRNKIILVIVTCFICLVTICTLLLVNKKPQLNEKLKNEMKCENRREKEQNAEKTRELGIYFKNSAF